MIHVKLASVLLDRVKQFEKTWTPWASYMHNRLEKLLPLTLWFQGTLGHFFFSFFFLSFHFFYLSIPGFLGVSGFCILFYLLSAIICSFIFVLQIFFL